MKTIISIIEAIMFNLLPPALAAPVVAMVKDILPLLAIALIRINLYIEMRAQKLQHSMSQKLQQAKLFKMDNVIPIDYLKKLRA